MKPSDLLKDLEKVDRTEEHLWGKKKVENAPLEQIPRELLESLISGFGAIPWDPGFNASHVSTGGNLQGANVVGNQTNTQGGNTQ